VVVLALRETLADSESRAGKDVQSGPVFDVDVDVGVGVGVGVGVDVGESATLRDIDAVLDEDAGDVFNDMVGIGDVVGLEVVRVLVALARPDKFAARFTCGDEATTEAVFKRRGASNIMDSGMRLEGATSG
jgi:hypothetical protein